MPLVDGIQHLTFLTADLDRLIAFYERVFEAQVRWDMEEEGLRHAFVEVGRGTMLHPFEVPGWSPPDPDPSMFQRGRLDHFALDAASEEAFVELRRRLMAEGASDGLTRDIGPLWILGFRDPDGAEVELILTKPGVPLETGLPRAEWPTVFPAGA
jgi:catechol 2,3-dioxygenase-like lactoylglutathione lyase family enzyme